MKMNWDLEDMEKHTPRSHQIDIANNTKRGLLIIKRAPYARVARTLPQSLRPTFQQNRSIRFRQKYYTESSDASTEEDHHPHCPSPSHALGDETANDGSEKRSPKYRADGHGEIDAAPNGMPVVSRRARNNGSWGCAKTACDEASDKNGRDVLA